VLARAGLDLERLHVAAGSVDVERRD